MPSGSQVALGIARTSVSFHQGRYFRQKWYHCEYILEHVGLDKFTERGWHRRQNFLIVKQNLIWESQVIIVGDRVSIVRVQLSVTPEHVRLGPLVTIQSNCAAKTLPLVMILDIISMMTAKTYDAASITATLMTISCGLYACTSPKPTVVSTANA
jgi:hypothetical protein